QQRTIFFQPLFLLLRCQG
ncbi:sodium/hydrogen exchanger family protein, partial [Vibrio parahaemolyticus V-223/04]